MIKTGDLLQCKHTDLCIWKFSSEDEIRKNPNKKFSRDIVIAGEILMIIENHAYTNYSGENFSSCF